MCAVFIIYYKQLVKFLKKIFTLRIVIEVYV